MTIKHTVETIGKEEDFCLHFVYRENCEVGNFCTCDSPVRSGTYYECAYGSCCGYKCEKCGRFL